MKRWKWFALGGIILGIGAAASAEKGERRNRVLQLLALLAGDLVVAKRSCGSVAGVIATWITRHGSEWQRLLAQQSASQSRRRRRQKEEMEAAVTDILTTLEGCKDDPAVIEVLPRLLALMPPELVTRAQRSAAHAYVAYR